jgi:hypothetical protein
MLTNAIAWCIFTRMFQLLLLRLTEVSHQLAAARELPAAYLKAVPIVAVARRSFLAALMPIVG